MSKAENNTYGFPFEAKNMLCRDKELRKLFSAVVLALPGGLRARPRLFLFLFLLILVLFPSVPCTRLVCIL